MPTSNPTPPPRPAPSPLLASVEPDLCFNPARHAAFDEVFVARVMEPTDACLHEIRNGVALLDRAHHAWVEFETAPPPLPTAPPPAPTRKLRDERTWLVHAPEADPRLAAVKRQLIDQLGPRDAPTATPRDPSAFHEAIDLDRRRRGELAARQPDARDRTAELGRIALAGPRAESLLQAIGMQRDPREAWPGPTDHQGRAESFRLLQETAIVGIALDSDPFLWELLIPISWFNDALAVICAWAVRLRMNLLPTGLDAQEALGLA